jgi:hypothetical protein
LSYTIALNITIIVFTSPNKSTFRFYHISHHIVNQTMFIPNFIIFIGLFVFGIIDFFKNIFESAIVFFKNSVFSGQIKR